MEERALGARYLVGARIGRGAMGEVFAGRTRETGEPVAVKYLRAEFAEDSDIVARFVQERKILLGIKGPHVVQVRDLVLDDERLAIVMELVEGKDLRDQLRKRGPLPERDAIDLCAQVLDGLADVHGSGIIHRDVKPENVLVAVSADGSLTAKITDFGIARIAQGQGITHMSGLLGTPAYMAPELALQENVTPAVDVYAVGVMAYELSAGATPFTSANAYAMLRKHVDEMPTKPSTMSDGMWSVVERMLAKDASGRPEAAAAAVQLRALAAAAAEQATMTLDAAAAVITADTALTAVPVRAEPTSLPGATVLGGGSTSDPDATAFALSAAELARNDLAETSIPSKASSNGGSGGGGSDGGGSGGGGSGGGEREGGDGDGGEPHRPRGRAAVASGIAAFVVVAVAVAAFAFTGGGSAQRETGITAPAPKTCSQHTFTPLVLRVGVVVTNRWELGNDCKTIAGTVTVTNGAGHAVEANFNIAVSGKVIGRTLLFDDAKTAPASLVRSEPAILHYSLPLHTGQSRVLTYSIPLSAPLKVSDLEHLSKWFLTQDVAQHQINRKLITAVVATTVVIGASDSTLHLDGVRTATVRVKQVMVNNIPIAGAAAAQSLAFSSDNPLIAQVAGTTVRGYNDGQARVVAKLGSVTSNQLVFTVMGGQKQPKLGHLNVVVSAPSVPVGTRVAVAAAGVSVLGGPLGNFTAQAHFTVSGGTCRANTCVALTTGRHVVTAVVDTPEAGSADGAGSFVATRSVASLKLSFDRSSVPAGASTTVGVTGYDSAGQVVGDVTTPSKLTITPEGSCALSVCAVGSPGVHTVTATLVVNADGATVSGFARLVVTPQPCNLANIAITPAKSTVYTGSNVTYAAEGFGTCGDDLGDVTTHTVFVASPATFSFNGGSTARDLPAGEYTINGTATTTGPNGGVGTGTTSLTVVDPPSVTTTSATTTTEPDTTTTSDDTTTTTEPDTTTTSDDTTTTTEPDTTAGSGDTTTVPNEPSTR